MFRKILLGLAALAVVGTAAFTITTVTSIPAGAASFNQHRHHNWRPAVRFYGSGHSYANCYVQRVIHTPYGPRVHTVNVCY